MLSIHKYMNNNYTKLDLKGPPAVPYWFFLPPLSISFFSFTFFFPLLPIPSYSTFSLSIFFFSLNIGLDLAWTGGQTGNEGTL